MMAEIGGCDSLSLKVNVVCNEGVFDKSCVLTFEMKNVVLTGSLAKSGVNSLPQLVVPVPLEGTLTAPKVSFTKALGKAVVDNIKGNAGAIATGAATGFLEKKMGGGKKDASGGAGDSVKKKISLPF